METEPDNWAAVKALFEAALKEDPAHRSLFLKEHCPDLILGAEVERLLAEYDKAGSFLSTPPFGNLASEVDTETPAQRLSEGEVLAGRFRIVRFLAAGGMGEVYKAVDVRLGREVAIKVVAKNFSQRFEIQTDAIPSLNRPYPAHLLPEEERPGATALERFWREARMVSSLNHPGICTIYELNESGDQPFIVLELLQGQSLDKAYHRRPMPYPKLLDFGVQVADALDAAHRKGILHRDIKPGNIFLLPSGQAKILDFGLAKFEVGYASHEDNSTAAMTSSHHLLTTPGAAIGTIAYMSPEQARGEQLDARSDVFSFGVVLYELATGQHPFRGPTPAVTFDRILNHAPSPASSLNPELPLDLEATLNKALEKDRDLRCQSAAELRAELRRLQRKSSGESVATAIVSRPANKSRVIPNPTRLDQRNRLQMLKQVRLDWIDGVLKKSLYQIARIEFGLQMKSDAVEQPLKTIVQTPDGPLETIPTGVSIGEVFDDHGGALLILGEPGTGKTTLLLELAQELLDRAELDENLPIPVVFNLSSWSVRRQTLDLWLVDELNERSDVPRGLARQWVETEQVLPLLDGLDEVAVDHRQACAEAINNFRRDHGLLQIAVCSRIADYGSLGTKLRLRTAIVVQPLAAFEIQDYLERIGEPAHAVRAALKEDPLFSELLETPLMLWVAMLAYRDAPVELSIEDTFEQRRRRLFANFIDAMFKRRSAETRYTQHQTLSSLCWLARALTGNAQTVFYFRKPARGMAADSSRKMAFQNWDLSGLHRCGRVDRRTDLRRNPRAGRPRRPGTIRADRRNGADLRADLRADHWPDCHFYEAPTFSGPSIQFHHCKISNEPSGSRRAERRRDLRAVLRTDRGGDRWAELRAARRADLGADLGAERRPDRPVERRAA